MIRTINGGKSNFHISARSIKPSCYNKVSRGQIYYLSNQSTEHYFLKMKQKYIHTTIRMVIDTA
jgi:YHS domain-containing protein